MKKQLLFNPEPKRTYPLACISDARFFPESTIRFQERFFIPSYNLLDPGSPYISKDIHKHTTIDLLTRIKSRPEPTEDQLIEGCRKHRRKDQKRLYDRYCDAMYTVAYRIVNDAHLAGDVLQEAFIQVFRDIGQFRGDSAVGAWIKTIVVRNALKRLKQEPWSAPMDENGNGGPVEWPEAMVGEDLEKAILALPDGYRSVFLLVEVEGYRHREVAEMLGISEGTSKSQLWHAKKQLQRILKDYVRR